MENNIMARGNSFIVHDLPKQERPRERFKKYGPGALFVQELLALVIVTALQGKLTTT
jgi:DNA repair protein RadC